MDFDEQIAIYYTTIRNTWLDEGKFFRKDKYWMATTGDSSYRIDYTLQEILAIPLLVAIRLYLN